MNTIYLKIIATIYLIIVPLFSHANVLIDINVGGGETTFTFNQTVVLNNNVTSGFTGSLLLVFENVRTDSSNQGGGATGSSPDNPALDFSGDSVSFDTADVYNSGLVNEALVLDFGTRLWNNRGIASIASGSVYRINSEITNLPATIPDTVTLNLVSGNNTIDLGTVTVVPEPSTYAMLLGFVVLGLTVTRRRLRR